LIGVAVRFLREEVVDGLGDLDLWEQSKVEEWWVIEVGLS
jgi:hypothetical protein